MLFVTGFADRDALAGVSEAQIVGKPFVTGELADKLRSVLIEEASEARRLSGCGLVRDL